jgi:hypothetical protein
MERVMVLLLGKSERRTVALALSLGISILSMVFGFAALAVLTRFFGREYIAATLIASFILLLIVASSAYMGRNPKKIFGCIFAVGCFIQYVAYLISFAEVTLYGQVVRPEFLIFMVGLFLVYRTVVECEPEETDE